MAGCPRAADNAAAVLEVEPAFARKEKGSIPMVRQQLPANPKVVMVIESLLGLVLRDPVSRWLDGQD
jgi:hypothetical protein